MDSQSRRFTASLVWLLACSMLFACQRVEQSKIELTQNQWRDIEEHLLDERPEPDYGMGVEFGEEIELIGVDVDGEFARGEEIEMTWYWQALDDVDEDWQIFVHFDSEEEPFRQNLDHYPLGEKVDDIFRTYHWEEGHIIADTQRFTVRDDYPSGEAVFYVGLFRGEQRSPVSNDGDATADHRAIGPTVEFPDQSDDAPPTPSPSDQPTQTIPQLDEDQAEESELDGRLQDSFWRHVPPIRLEGLAPDADKNTVVQAVYTEDTLLVGARVHDDDIRATIDEPGPDLSSEEVFQVVVAPGGEDDAYVEVQVNPLGTVYGLVFDGPPADGEQDRHLNPERGEPWNPDGLRAEVAVRGAVGNSEKLDEQWSAAVEIPLTELPGVDATPQPRDEWKANFYRVDRPDGDTRHDYGWATAVGGDLHRVDQFGTLKFGDTIKEVPALQRAQTEGTPQLPEGLRERIRERAAAVQQ